jgi:hypothetical protein
VRSERSAVSEIDGVVILAGHIRTHSRKELRALSNLGIKPSIAVNIARATALSGRTTQSLRSTRTKRRVVKERKCGGFICRLPSTSTHRQSTAARRATAVAEDDFE